ncbi:sugar ABC transporter substrate-binding protein [Cryptosporangium arvum]|uniref:ABC-type sugar transport system, periplasmic component n=1 Tax=Cryptosporangium arvum DSM 44712 TaxID=927661 RepID=A0A010ZTW4_9ACTN|nr:sugar ABC transporter substrate-binding protein [Cryptosporangium arvum]EXG80652.1 ABC-type sugar transport system, periplasmic component [Cryptosporangium arvum DSM 44712]
MRRRTFLSATAVLAAATVAGCDVVDADENHTIGLAEASTTIPFLAVMDDAFTARAKEHGMKTVILNGELDNAKQAANIETLIAKQVDLIVVVSSNPTAVIPAIKHANRVGIPVIALNAKLDEGAELVSYVGCSDYQYGQGEAKLLVEALPNGGDVAIVLGPPGDSPTVQRLAGMKSVLASHPGIRIVATPSDGFDNSRNLAVTQDLLSKYPRGTIDAIVAEGPQMYVGAEYARKNGRDDVVFIAGDYSKQVEAAIKSGALYGTVDQSPVLQGQRAADFAWRKLTGKDVPKESLIPLPAITRANVAANPAEWG